MLHTLSVYRGKRQSPCGLCQLPWMGVQRPGSSCVVGVREESGILPRGIWSGAGGEGRAWAWHRQVLPNVYPPHCPPDYALHWCRMVVQNNLTGVQSARMLNNHRAKGTARRWVQMRVDNFRVRARTDCGRKMVRRNVKRRGCSLNRVQHCCGRGKRVGGDGPGTWMMMVCCSMWWRVYLRLNGG